MNVVCKNCGRETILDQPHPYHAGFGSQGFLYDDAGTCTLVWSSYDPDYERLLGCKHQWSLDTDERRRVEESLKSAPSGGRWRFANPPRCASCAHPIGRSSAEDVYFLLFPGSIDLERGPLRGFGAMLREEAS